MQEQVNSRADFSSTLQERVELKMWTPGTVEHWTTSINRNPNSLKPVPHEQLRELVLESVHDELKLKLCTKSEFKVAKSRTFLLESIKDTSAFSARDWQQSKRL